MSNPMDDATELFSSYEAELKLIYADIDQKLQQIPELQGEARKADAAKVDRLLEEAKELLDQMRIEKQNIPQSAKSKINSRFRNYETDVDQLSQKLKTLDKRQLFGSRYQDDPSMGGDEQLEQRQQLLSGTERLDRSSNRIRESQRIALETEDIGRNTLADLGQQRETIQNTRARLFESEGYTDRSIKTLRGMARWLPIG
ncbi:vesicle transport V-snare protein [Aulographum hederae CBS 113979]|uniref:Vesicle transport V-snare protein n=1 Tax=Aulographum hederae CBS 113979 TaxID=1176131 RepID=A0A6G1HER6_9PEZI|nr:vesicle transport V-snare protein [Aulographum hederae CBS 113979]